MYTDNLADDPFDSRDFSTDQVNGGMGDEYHKITDQIGDIGAELATGATKLNIAEGLGSLTQITSSVAGSLDIGKLIGELFKGTADILNGFFPYYDKADPETKRMILDRMTFFPGLVKDIVRAGGATFLPAVKTFLDQLTSLTGTMMGSLSKFMSGDEKAIQDMNNRIAAMNVAAAPLTKLLGGVGKIAAISPPGLIIRGVNKLHDWLNPPESTKDTQLAVTTGGSPFSSNNLKIAIIIILVIIILYVLYKHIKTSHPIIAGYLGIDNYVSGVDAISHKTL